VRLEHPVHTDMPDMRLLILDFIDDVRGVLDQTVVVSGEIGRAPIGICRNGHR